MTDPQTTHAAVILLAAIITNNILLADFLGLCSFIAVSRTMRTSLGLGAAVIFVMGCTAPLNYAIYYGILAEGAPLLAVDLIHLKLVVFIMVVAGFVQLVEMFIERFTPLLYYALGIFLPLITVNCAILGASLFMIEREYGFAQTVGYGVGSGVGWAVAICLMAGIRQRLQHADVPEPLRGLGITMIVTGLMAMAFLGFTGMARIQ
ncbi:MAG: NADH:ubiquinone reductase (Na(+)-transporting) subunit E [Planctomycetota bacterium]